MNRNSIVALALASVLALGGCGRSHPAGSPRLEANDFFQKLGESRIGDAYKETAFSFQTQTSLKNFGAAARELGLTGGGTVICNWNKEESPAPDEVKLIGDISGKGGVNVPVVVTLIQERGTWRVYAVRKPGEHGKKEVDYFSLLGKGAELQAGAQEVPSAKVNQRLVLESMALFNDALQQQNFSDFYSQVSEAWQNQLTVGQLKQSFQPFIDAKVNLSDVQKMEPIFDAPPEINSDGILFLKGHCEAKPYQIYFVFRYVYEFPYWKLYGMEVQIR